MSSQKLTGTDLLLGLIIGAMGFVCGAAVTNSYSNSDEEALRNYRAVLIRHGSAEYRADSNGEPVFVIIDRETKKQNNP